MFRGADDLVVQHRMEACQKLGEARLSIIERGLLCAFRWVIPFHLNKLAFALLNDYSPKGKSHVLDALVGAYNMLALVSALVLGVGMTPFVLLGTWYVPPMSAVYIVMVVSLVLGMAQCMMNLLAITSSLTFLSGLDPAQVHVVVATFPFFGIPFVFFVLIVIWCIVFLHCFLYTQLPSVWFCYGMVIIASPALLAFAMALVMCSRYGANLMSEKHLEEAEAAVQSVPEGDEALGTGAAATAAASGSGARLHPRGGKQRAAAVHPDPDTVIATPSPRSGSGLLQ